MQRKKITYCLIVAMFLSLSMYSGDPQNPNKPPPPHPELSMVVGIAYLFIAGIAYVGYVLRRKE